MRGGAGVVDTTEIGHFGPEALRAWIARAADASPGKPFIVSVDDERTVDYAALERAARSIAAFLAARGVGANDRVVLLSGNSPEQLIAYIGVLAYGATVCTVHVEMNRAHLDAILPALVPQLVLYEPGLGLEPFAKPGGAPWHPLGRLDRAEGFFGELGASRAWPAAGAAPGDDAVIYYTSGTSARPKGVVVSYREVLANAAATADAFGLGTEDRVYDYRSFSWASAQLLSGLGTLNRGATLLLGRKFSRRRFFREIERFGATVAAGNPTVIHLLLEEPAPDPPPAQLRFVISSSAPLPVVSWRRFEERFGIPVSQGYGTSETGWIAGGTGRARRIGTAGKPLPYQRVAIVSDDGSALACGETGHVEVGGFAGQPYRYIAEDGAIRVSAVGRVRTGDLGFLDADGYLHVTGREKELIIRGGVNISPLEIDDVLLQMPEVLEAATVGEPDPVYGEEVVSYVVLRPGASAADVLRFCAARVPAFKTPKRIHVCSRLPKTERGKLDRKTLAGERNNRRTP